MNDYFYAKEKLMSAVRTLATDTGDVRSRLRKAYSSCCTLRTNDFPKELQADWEWIMKQLTRFQPIHKYQKEMGTVNLTLSKIKNSTGSKIAEKIYDLYGKLEDYLEQQE